MNRNEAKYILGAYHLGGEDAEDAQFRAPLELVKCDPSLAEWFAREQELDTRLSEKLRAFPVPQNLKQQLLAARQVIPMRAGWPPVAWIFAAAACAALLIGLAVVLLRPS